MKMSEDPPLTSIPQIWLKLGQDWKFWQLGYINGNIGMTIFTLWPFDPQIGHRGSRQQDIKVTDCGRKKAKEVKIEKKQ